MGKLKKLGIGFVVFIIVILALGQMAKNYNPVEAELTSKQKQNVNLLKDACETQAAMALLQSNAAWEIVHEKCQERVDAMIDRYAADNGQ